MMKAKRRITAMALVLILALMNAVSAYGASTVVMSKLIVSKSEVTLAIGETATLTATAVYSDNSTDNVTAYSDWTSEDGAIASVYNGTITAKAEGTATLAVTYSGFTQSIQVTVTKKVKALTKDKQSLELRKGASGTITLVATYSDNATEDVTSKAEWSSTNESVATVVNGKVTGWSSGTASIVATYGSKSVAVDVQVEIVSRLTASKSEISLLLNGSDTITLEASFADGTTEDVTSDAVWSSSKPGVADVLKGKITAYGAGSATITAAYGTKTATITVEVDKTVRLEVSEDELFLSLKGTKQLTLQAEYANGQTADVTESATWTSSDSGVADVYKGLVTGNKAGSVTITGTYNGKSVHVAVDVEVVRFLDLQPSKLSMNSGDAQAVTLTAVYADGTKKEIQDKAAWTSSNNTVAMSIKGTVTAYSAGQAKIIGSYGGQSATVNVSVDAPSELTTSTKDLYIEAGEAYQADAIAVFANGSEEEVTEEAVWSTSDEAVAKVKNGIVTGVASGSAEIKAEYGDFTLTIKVFVEVARRLDVSKSKLSMLTNGTETLMLTATYADGSTKDVSALASWVSSDEKIADVIKGKITAYSPGNATITASYGTKTATITVEVDKTLILSANATDIFLNVDGTRQLALTAVYADGRTVNVTDEADWSTGNEAIAYVNKGLVTAVKSGSTTIKGSFNGKTVDIAVDVETAQHLELSKEKLALNIGDSFDLTARATYINGLGEEVTEKAVWSTDNDDVAYVMKGKITAYQVGTARITATYGGRTATVTVNVGIAEKLTVASKTVRLATDEEYQASVTAVYSDGREEDVTDEAVWSSSDAKVASVNKGLLTGNASGSASVTAEYAGLSVKLTVKVDLAEELEASDSLVALLSSETWQVTLTAVDEEGATVDVTDDAEWKTSKSTVVSVKKGLVKAHAKGKATVTAVYGGQTVAIAVEVDQIARITASEPSLSLKSGQTQTAAVEVTLNDGQTRDVTSLAEWKTSSYKVATVKNGAIHAAGAGKTTVSAKYAGKTVKIAVDVDTLKYFETSEVNLNLKVGQQVQVTATATYSDQSEANVSKAALWTSSKIAVATSKDGLIKATGAGKATITVTFAGKKTKINVVVTK